MSEVINKMDLQPDRPAMSLGVAAGGAMGVAGHHFQSDKSPQHVLRLHNQLPMKIGYEAPRFSSPSRYVQDQGKPRNNARKLCLNPTEMLQDQLTG